MAWLSITHRPATGLIFPTGFSKKKRNVSSMRLCIGWRRLGLLALWAGLTSPVWAEGKVWALVIGVDEYVRASIPKLRYAVADAKLFSQALQESLKVPRDQIFLFTSDSPDENSQPRSTAVAYRLSWLKQKVKADDTLIFYFAGHGVTQEGEPFLLTEEADDRSALTLKVSALTQGEVVDALRQVRAANCWLVLDACRNNPADPQKPGLSAEASRSVTSADVGVAQTATMFSCKLGERAWEWDEKKHGYFTYFLVEGLRLGAADSNGQVTLQSLSQYVGNQVGTATQKVGLRQNPWMLYGGPGQERWLLARVEPSRAGGDDSSHVARLEGLQARLDQEVARRVAAEQKAALEQSKRLELEQRLALLEGQLSGKTPAISSRSLAASPSPDGPLNLRREVQRLSQENAMLKQKLKNIEDHMASRRLGRSPDLSRVWKQAVAREQASLAGLARGGLSPQQRLRLQQSLHQAYTERMEVLEKACSAPLGLDRLSPDSEGGKLVQKIQIERQRQQICLTRLTAADLAQAEASLRKSEADTRERIVAMEALLNSPKMAEVALIEDRLRQLHQDRQRFESELAGLHERRVAQRRQLDQQEQGLASMLLILNQVPACDPVPEPLFVPPPP
jgi:hypothetical protein